MKDTARVSTRRGSCTEPKIPKVFSGLGTGKNRGLWLLLEIRIVWCLVANEGNPCAAQKLQNRSRHTLAERASEDEQIRCVLQLN